MVGAGWPGSGLLSSLSCNICHSSLTTVGVGEFSGLLLSAVVGSSDWQQVACYLDLTIQLD